jgi:NhaP-type Na+/H+ and K+/H+ antiporter
MLLGSIGVAFGPQKSIGVVGSYIIYMISRFIIACGTRGINVTGFVLGNRKLTKFNVLHLKNFIYFSL